MLLPCVPLKVVCQFNLRNWLPVTKRGPMSHTNFHSQGHIECPACEKFRAMRTVDESLPFSQAAEIWINNHSQYVLPSTLRVYMQHVRKLIEFLNQIPIGEIHIGNIRAYQQWRLEQAGPEIINAEISSVLAPIMAEIDKWKFFVRVYKPLRVTKKRIRQSMTEEEVRRLLTVALDASKPRRLLAGHCLIVMWNTGMGFGELRHLKRQDVFLHEEAPYITVNEGLKNPYRMRTIALNWIALRSMRWILHRWEDLGGASPNDYILPHAARRAPGEKDHRRKTAPIFEEPMRMIWNGARKILDEAGLKQFQIYDMRSHFATKIMENPEVSESEAGEYIGHSKVAREMNRRYFAPKMKKMVKAVEKVALDPAPAVKLIAFPGGRK
jgi:integrase